MEQGRVRGGILKMARGEVGSPGELGTTTMLFGGTAAMGAHDAAEARNSFRLSDTAFKGTIGLREAETAMLQMHLEVSDKRVHISIKDAEFEDHRSSHRFHVVVVDLSLPPSLPPSLSPSLCLSLSFHSLCPLSLSLCQCLNPQTLFSPPHSHLCVLSSASPSTPHSLTPLSHAHALIPCL
jgi:hypothetical protein